MKKKLVRSLVGKVLSGGFCVCTISGGLAATNYIIDTYPVSTGASDVTAWQQWWGSTPVTVTFDPAMDANNDVNSGSVRFDANFAPSGGDAAMVRTLPDPFVNNIGGVYGTFEFDLYWSTNSALDGNGTYCKFNNIPFDGGAVNWEWANSAYYVPTNYPPVWHHVVHAFPPGFNPTTLGGWAFYLYENNNDPNGENFVRGPMTFWVDNVQYVTNSIPPAPPHLDIKKVTSSRGLQMVASVFNSPGSRQNVRAINPYGWVGSPDPVTYSFTITNFPDASHSGFEARMLLVPDAGGETAPDHNEPNVVYLRVLNNADGTATASFRYKTNSPGVSGDSAYNPHTAATITNSTALGKWSVTFTGDTGVSLVTPSGSSTNFTLPSDVPPQFASLPYFYLGISPNVSGNIAQSATFSRAEIVTGTTTNLTDNFLTDPLDLLVWQKLADDANSVFVLPATATYWVTWSLPDTGFQLLNSTNLANTNSWVDPMPTTVFQNDIRRAALLTNTPPTASYFRLLQTNSP